MRSILAILLVGSSAVIAQEEEQWLCGAEQASGFVFQNGDWRPTMFVADNAMFTLDGEKGAVEFSETIYVLECNSTGPHLLCSDGMQSFALDTQTGRAGFSSLQGALIQSNAFMTLFQCNKI